MTKTRFSVYDAIVIDLYTGLTWQRNVHEDRFKLEEAQLYAAELRLGGYDWRVPTKDELLRIIDRSRHDPAIDVEAFPDTPSEYFWTVSPHAGSSDLAWIVDFNSGGSDVDDVHSLYRVRCVRG